MDSKMREVITIIDNETAQDLLRYIKEDKPTYQFNKKNHILEYKDDDYNITISKEFVHLFEEDQYDDKLIFGKNPLKEIISLEVKDNNIHLFLNNGDIQIKPMIYWMLSNRKLDSHFEKLEGNQHYQYIRKFANSQKFSKFCTIYRYKDLFKIYNEKEAAMIYYGYTMFKGLKVKDVPILSFDIEANGLTHDKDSKVFLITNTFRDSSGKITKKHFRVDHYTDDTEMIEDWCEWVVEMDPIILNGHNIFGYDLPYLEYCYGKPLPLGKGGDPVMTGKKESKFRVDGNQSWSYFRKHIFGRHIIDGMFLAVKYDLGRNYPSWGLKPIAEFEGLIRADRQFYDASKIGQNWADPVEREKIVQYGIDDSDDSLALYDLHIPSIFYMTQSVPKSFQLMSLSASGAQLNAIMVRAYLQDGHSIPKTSEKEYVAGGMSYGVPGVYKNVLKWDAKSYYPNTILTFDIYDKDKDPKAYFLEMVRYFTNKRFEQKDKYKETGNIYYNDLQSASKVFINSAYGLLGTAGLNFNSFKNAQLVTKCCRSGLQKAIIWATSRSIHSWWYEYSSSSTHTQDFPDCKFIDTKTNISFIHTYFNYYDLVNLDTDSLSFCKQDQTPFCKAEKERIYKELNDIMYCEWEDDGSFDKVLVVKAKNYVLVSGDKKIVKGASLRDTKKEPALIELLSNCVDHLLGGDNDVTSIYHKYIKEAYNITDISRWATKKSVSDKVLKPERANEQNILNAIKDRNPREGDKFYLYTALDGERQKVEKGEPVFLKDETAKMIPNNILKCVEDWKHDEYKIHYIKRVYSTLEILKTLLDMDQYIKFHNVGNQKLLNQMFTPLGSALNENM